MGAVLLVRPRLAVPDDGAILVLVWHASVVGSGTSMAFLVPTKVSWDVLTSFVGGRNAMMVGPAVA